MKINKFSKKKDGMYSITLEDDTKLLVHEDLILKYELLIKKKFTDSEKEQILEENLIYIAYNLALKYITKKMRSRKEVEEYLKSQKVDSFIIERVIEMLDSAKYIDEETYAISFINDKILLTNDGPNKVIKALLEKEIKQDIIHRYIEIFNEEIQVEKITKLITKMIKTNRNKSAHLLKNKIIEYLVNLGYDRIIIMNCLDNTDIVDDENMIKKEYQKIYNKLSKKYSGKELEYKVRQKMYSLGFSTNYME